jgi:hypothetical protein
LHDIDKKNDCKSIIFENPFPSTEIADVPEIYANPWLMLAF